MFAPFQSAPAHQIGGCAVHDGLLYVGVGDGGNPTAASDLDVLLGKIVCLTTDGAPCPGARFQGVQEPVSDYVWAYGLRNPFGLTMVDGQVFIAGNGVNSDRFVRAEAGGDYLWDGSDDSILSAADAVFSPPYSPVQLTFVPAGSPLLPQEYGDTFAFAAFNGKGEGQGTGLIALGYDLQRSRVSRVSDYLLEYRGEGLQHVVGVAAGPDGLYAVPSMPDATGTSAILRLTYDPAREHAVLIGAFDGEASRGAALFQEKGCVSCHSISGEGGGIGPSLDGFGLTFRLTERLNSAQYEEQLAAVDQLDEEPFVSWRDARQEVLAAEGTERTEAYIKYQILEPKFDGPDSQMPNLGLTESESEAIRDYLIPPSSAFKSAPEKLLSDVLGNKRIAAAGFGVGGVAATLGLGCLWALLAVLRRRRRRGVTPTEVTASSSQPARLSPGSAVSPRQVGSATVPHPR